MKPADSGTATPAATPRTPTTSYDVDIYQPKAGDSWEAISREFYNDAKYATALRAYNQNRALQGGPVDVPPIHVLRRGTTAPAPIPGAVIPANRTGTAPDPWAATGASTGPKTFRVPDGGMSLRAVAKIVLGSEQRWDDIHQLNPEVNPNKVPAGTDLKLPSDARVQ